MCRLVSPNSDDLCLIKDISEFGAKAQTAQKLEVGNRVTFEFGNQFSLLGTVRWSRDRYVGVEFDSAMELSRVLRSPSRILRDVGNSTDTRRQIPRIRRCAHVRIYLQGREHAAELYDLSPGGAGIELTGDKRLQVGDWVQCEIDGISERTATVRWVDNARVGLSFDTPLPLRGLDEWLVETANKCNTCTSSTCGSPSLRCIGSGGNIS